MAVDALAAGKDVYLEKPITHTIAEGATLTHAVRTAKNILQCGSSSEVGLIFAMPLIWCRRAASVALHRCEPIGGRTITGTGRPNPSTSRLSIGSSGSGPLLNSPLLRKSLIIGAGSGILAAAP